MYIAISHNIQLVYVQRIYVQLVYVQRVYVQLVYVQLLLEDEALIEKPPDTLWLGDEALGKALAEEGHISKDTLEYFSSSLARLALGVVVTAVGR
ncbi:hypothetical protein EYF80_038208 [Liparis tanakae]|uniref:Uncharacterized protein n=1 Tax=Liparis tanakae TaxID=230148 RepID=A0A4Z2GDY8_9TELE|nr:hypothetical protein EYF80_038208 [Liparis tanakae]